MQKVLRKEFEEKLAQIAEEARKRDDFAVIYHYDADGITAGAIAALALERMGKKVNCRAVKQLYSETIEEIKGMGKNYIFVDFGSSLVKELKESFGNNFFVLDHHLPKDEDYEFHANPCIYGISGANEISGAGVTYLFAKKLDAKNMDLAALAVVGAVGDMQDFDGKLKGLNIEIAEDAVSAGVLEKKNDLRLYGRISRPLVSFLCFSSNPILPELTANEENCHAFLKNLGIELRAMENWRSYEDLSTDEKKKLTTALILKLKEFNVPEWKIQELVGEVYTLKNEEPKSSLRDAKEFATMLNACGRNKIPEVALRVCMGDREENYDTAMAMLTEHRRLLRQGIELMHERGVDEKEWFYFFDAGEEIKDSLVGIVAGMLYGSGAIESNKPIIAFGRYEDGNIKVSARANKELVRRGVNLGQTLKEIGNALGEGNEGGGHPIAAGMKLQPEKEEEFLEMLNKKIGESVGK